MTKMTKRDYFNSLLNIAEVAANPDLTAFIQHELELLAKKNSSEKKPTATQVANESVKQAILDGLDGCDEGKTISEMLNLFPALEGMQNQKVSALMRQLIADGLVERVEIKRKAYFRKVEG